MHAASPALINRRSRTRTGGKSAFYGLSSMMRRNTDLDLKNFFGEHKKVAVAFSGGADSAYLLYAAKKYGADVKAYFITT